MRAILAEKPVDDIYQFIKTMSDMELVMFRYETKKLEPENKILIRAIDDELKKRC